MASFKNESSIKKYRCLQEIINDLSEVLLPPERISIADAAAKYRRVYNPPAYVGPWSNETVPYLREPMDLLESREHSAVCVVAPAQSAKALALDTPIPTPDGWTTMGELSPGVVILGENNQPVVVTLATDVMVNHKCYRVEVAGEHSVVADAGHLWTVHTPDGFRTITTEQLKTGCHYVPAVFKNNRMVFPERVVTKVEPVESVPVRCIQVDNPSHLFLAGTGLIPTHNTEVILNWIAYNVRCDPSDLMVVEKARTEAQAFSKMKVDRLLRHSPEIGQHLISRRTADNTFDKQFKSGTYLMINWPTENALSGKSLRRVALTDYDRMPQDIGGEGSPFDLARRRTNSYKRLGMTYVESSPSFDVINPRWRAETPHEAPPTEGVLGIYNRGDRRRRYWQCPHCRNWFEPHFNTLQWPQSADPMECAEQAFMACPHCFQSNGAVITQDMREEIDNAGVWLRDGEKIDQDGKRSGTGRRSDIASFWVMGPNTAFGQWKTLVLNYLLAMQEYESTGNDRPLKTTINTDQGLPYTPPHIAESRAPEDIMARAVDIGDRVVPTKVRFLMAGIDVQKNRFVVQVHGVVPATNGFDLVVIDRFDIRKSERYDQDGERFWVNPGAYPEDWDRITEKVLDKTYPTDEPEPRQMSIRAVFCDSGGRAGVTTNAYDYYRKLKTEGYGGRFWLVKGDGMKTAPRVRKTFPDSGRKDRKAGARGEIPVLMLNTDLLKDWLDKALDRTEPGGGYIEFPDHLDLSFYKELCAEIKNPQNGKWENPKKLRNESTDLINYCYAGCIFFRVEKLNWDDPPSWADEWDRNPLVTSAGEDNPVKPVQQTGNDVDKLRQLASQLG